MSIKAEPFYRWSIPPHVGIHVPCFSPSREKAKRNCTACLESGPGLEHLVGLAHWEPWKLQRLSRRRVGHGQKPACSFLWCTCRQTPKSSASWSPLALGALTWHDKESRDGCKSFGALLPRLGKTYCTQIDSWVRSHQGTQLADLKLNLKPRIWAGSGFQSGETRPSSSKVAMACLFSHEDVIRDLHDCLSEHPTVPQKIFGWQLWQLQAPWLLNKPTLAYMAHHCLSTNPQLSDWQVTAQVYSPKASMCVLWHTKHFPGLTSFTAGGDWKHFTHTSFWVSSPPLCNTRASELKLISCQLA